MARRGDNPIQPVADAIGNITHAYTSTVKIVVFGALALGVIITAMFVLAAPAIVEEAGARAETISDKAIEAAREEARAHAMAEEGWGYPDPAASAATDPAGSFDDTARDYDSGDEYVDHWGLNTE